jgi:quercetin dioxygenase-like cupin family protein
MRTLTLASVISAFIILPICTSDAQSNAPPAVVKPLLTRSLPELPGKEVSMVTVEYPPGGVSAPHRHGGSTFVYMLEGAVVMQVAGGKEVTLHPGDTFHELPTDIHNVSRNASASAPAKFLVFLVKDEGAPGTLPVN